MQLLLDTHLLLWAAEGGKRIPGKLRKLISNEDHTLFFSVASLWEIAIKANLGRPDFTLDASVFRRLLIDNGYAELAISGSHVIAAGSLPPLHRDLFDRLLVAQAISEGFTLLTSDSAFASYPGDILIA